ATPVMSPARATTLRAQPFQHRPQPGCTPEAVRAKKTRPCGGAPLMCAAAARARPDRFGLSDQAAADRRTRGWGMGGAGAGPPVVTAARRACTERNASP
ncbi:MAG: hypothetical protein ACREIL_00070, partial [Nitrospiraceae bacterium]